jgi:dolichyl-phosphate-mannose--protein O-mannosyl transferase
VRNTLPITIKTKWWITMISVKTSLAFVIAFALAVLAYLISSAAFAANLTHLLPSIFIIVTVVCFMVVSSVQSSARPNSQSVASELSSSLANNTVEPAPADADETSTLYVGNLAYKANEQIVQEYFEKVAVVKSVRLVKDKRTGRRKGFGFIEINSGDETAFIEKLNESELMERNIIVRPANEKQH